MIFKGILHLGHPGCWNYGQVGGYTAFDPQGVHHTPWRRRRRAFKVTIFKGKNDLVGRHQDLKTNLLGGACYWQQGTPGLVKRCASGGNPIPLYGWFCFCILVFSRSLPPFRRSFAVVACLAGSSAAGSRTRPQKVCFFLWIWHLSGRNIFGSASKSFFLY